jgi:hypothetical protein
MTRPPAVDFLGLPRAAGVFAQREQEAIPNWPAPLFWSSAHVADVSAEIDEGADLIPAESMTSVPRAALPSIAW